jgi:hypothetical protein
LIVLLASILPPPVLMNRACSRLRSDAHDNLSIGVARFHETVRFADVPEIKDPGGLRFVRGIGDSIPTSMASRIKARVLIMPGSGNGCRDASRH